MRLGYFTMPMHPAHRPPAETLEEDREAIILADKLGFYDAFVGEHLTEKSENVTNSFIFLASVIHATKNIKLATDIESIALAPDVDRLACRDVRSPFAWPFHLWREPRRAVVGCGSARHAAGRPQ